MIETIYSPEHYVGDGVTASLPFTWRILAKSDLTVYAKNAAGIVTTLQLGTDYTIPNDDVDDDMGGDVILTDPTFWNTQDIFIVRNTAKTQLTHMPDGFPFSTAAVEKSLDRITMFAQELLYLYRQTLHFQQSSEAVDIILPDPEAGKLLQYNSDADGMDNVLASGLDLTHTIIGPIAVAEGDITAVITHNLNSASASLIGFSASWHTSHKVVSQTANAITIEFGTSVPTGGGTIKAEVAI